MFSRLMLEKYQVRFYFIAILAGAAFGLLSPLQGAESLIQPALALMLFATFMQVPLLQLAQAVRNTRFLCALVVTQFIALPLLCMALLMLLPDQPLLRFAVLFVLLTPCVDYVITFTHLGKGNASLLLAMTPWLLMLQLLFVPLYMQWLLGAEITQLIAPQVFIDTFVYVLLIPCLLAIFMQWLQTKNVATHIKPLFEVIGWLTVPATATVLFLVPFAVMPYIEQAKQYVLAALLVYVLFAVLAPVVGYVVATIMRLSGSEKRTLCFSSSYRNSLVILPFAWAVPDGMPIVPAVILMQTVVELCMLPLYLRIIPGRN